MQIYRVEWYEDDGQKGQEYYTNPVIAAQRLIALQAVGCNPTLESVCVFVD